MRELHEGEYSAPCCGCCNMAKRNAALRMITPPEATNTGPGFNRWSGGGAQWCGFEKRVGAYALTEGGRSRSIFKHAQHTHAAPTLPLGDTPNTRALPKTLALGAGRSRC